MADKKGYKKKTIKEEFGKSGGFGKYQEGKGGGTPRGGIWGGKDGRVGWDNRTQSESMPSGAHRDEQPRTKDGKFTYNSVNGKELSDKSDPNRGKTVNPLLTGGENGVYIDESTYDHDVKDASGNVIHKKGEKISASKDNVKKQFSEKKGAYWEQYKGKWHQAGGEAIVGGKVKINAKDIVDYAKAGKYVDDKFVFYDPKEGKLETEMWKSKSGTHTAEEKKALAKAGKGEKYVKDKDGAIAVAKKYKPKKKVEKAKEEETIKPETPVEPTKPEVKEEIKEEVVENVDVPAEPEVKSEPWGKSGKFTKAQYDDYVNQIKTELSKIGEEFNPDDWSDDEIEELMLEDEKNK